MGKLGLRVAARSVALSIVLGLAAAGCGESGDGGGGPAPSASATPGAPSDPPTPSGSPTPGDPECVGPLPDGELVVVPVSFSGGSVIFRLDGCSVQTVTSSPPDLSPMTTSYRGRFSTPDVLWSVGYGPDGPVLTRSDDAGSTWVVASVLPGELRGAIDLLVDRGSDGTLIAWVAMAGIESVATPGPEIWTRSLEGGAWEQIPGIPQTPFLGFDPMTAFLGRRAGQVELVRSSAGKVALEVLTGERRTVLIEDFAPFAYTTLAERGWIGGGILSPDGDDVPAVITVASRGAEIQLQRTAIGGGAQGSVQTLDFRDERHGFACGGTWSAAPFCAYSDDGGASWTLGELPFVLGGTTMLGVVRTGDDTGFATWRAFSSLSGVIATRDGGRTWTQVELPPLAPVLVLGSPARSSSAVEDGPPPRPGPTAAPPAPTSVPPPLTGDEPGPFVWVAGEVAHRGPGLTGTVLRSTDGGASFTELLALAGTPIVDVAFVDREVGWAVGGRHLLRTNDGGTTFVEQAPSIDPGAPVLRIDLIRAADRDHAVAKIVTGTGEEQERDALLVTSDGGATWTAAEVPPWPFLTYVPDACLTRTGRGILSFSGLVFLSSDFGRTWTMGPAFPYERPCCSGYGFQTPRLACGGDLDMWILVGSDPRDDLLWYSPDGGTTWRDRSDGVDERPASNSTMIGEFLDSGSAWLSVREQDGRALLLRSHDGGATWQRSGSPFRFVDAPPASFLLDLPSAIAFADDARGLVLVNSYRADGDESFLLRTSNGGGSWERAALPADVLPIGVDTRP